MPQNPIAWPPHVAAESRAMQDVFTEIFDKRGWGDSESLSGAGSVLAQTETLRSALPKLVEELGIRSILDIPCGDLHWMSTVELGVERYCGADIVHEIVEQNAARYPDREFWVLDLAEDELPRVDLVFSRDCLVHFSDEDVARALDNVKRSGSTYFAATTFTDRETNVPIATGGWRTMNLQIAPFSLPEPVLLVNEDCTERYELDDGSVLTFTDKSLGVWRVSDL